jgi:hypothetical protein
MAVMSALRPAPAAIYPQEDSCCSCLLQAKSTQDRNAAGKVRPVEKGSDIVGNPTRELPANNRLSGPTMLLCLLLLWLQPVFFSLPFCFILWSYVCLLVTSLMARRYVLYCTASVLCWYIALSCACHPRR